MKKVFIYPGYIPLERIDGEMKALAQLVGYKYSNIDWLKKAFYSEIVADNKIDDIGKECKRKNEERYANSPMGTLGDSVLKLILTDYYFNMGKTSEEITSEKSEIEKNVTLYDINLKYELFRFSYNNTGFYDDALETQGSPNSLAQLPNSKHSRYFEALVAAVFKDLGYEQTVLFVKRILELDNYTNTSIVEIDKELKI